MMHAGDPDRATGHRRQAHRPVREDGGMSSTWSAVLPVKRLSAGKSRLRGALPRTPHRDLALAVALDTVAAVAACPLVHRLVVVTDDPLVRAATTALGAQVIPDPPTPTLNAAFTTGATFALPPPAARAGPDGARPVEPWPVDGTPAVGVVALTADLPALRPDELAAALRAAEAYPRSFVPDAEGTGTTLLAVRGVPLDPRFGPGSAAAHTASGAARLAGAWPSLRRDVDTPANLTEAALLGLGPRTGHLLSARSA
jgi:2-phospho-L-lactate guanylyltransferase